MSGFRYPPLKPCGSEVRLLTLEPGSGDAPLRGELKVVPFNATLHSNYDALSYAWGNKNDLHPMTVIYESTEHCVEIRKNLWLALRHVRKENENLVIWFDVACIDQDNRKRRSEELKMVGDIYKHCRTCRVWLGDFNHNDLSLEASLAPDLLQKFATLSDAQDSQQPGAVHLGDLECFTPASDSDKRTDVKDSYIPNFTVLTALLNLDWWKRTWVIQELALPAQLELLFGNAKIDYNVLEDAVERLTHHSLSCCKNHRLGLRGLGFDAVVAIEEKVAPMVTIRKQRIADKRITFTNLRRRFCGSEASRKHDCFYGFLGLVNDKSFLEPNYSLNARSAIANATFSCVQNEEEGFSLLLGERLFRATTEEYDIPSWVSDACFCTFPSKWALMEQRRLSMYLSFATNSTNIFGGELALSQTQTLKTKSYHVATIKTLGDPLVDDNQWSRVPRILLSWMQLASIDHSSWSNEAPALNSRVDVFCKTLINDSVEKDEGTLSYQRSSFNGQDSDYVKLLSLWKSLKLFADSQESLNTALQFLEAAGQKILDTVVDWAGTSFLDYFDGGAKERNVGQVADDAGPPNRATTGIPPPELHDLVISQDAKTIYHLLACLWERALFVTEKDSIGLAPRDTKENDEVHVIAGFPAPFILRRVGKPGSQGDDEDPQYRVVGNGFFYGFMGGTVSGMRQNEIVEETCQTIVLL